MQMISLLVLGFLFANTQSTPDISQQIAELMFRAPGTQPGYRPVHAKGIVCKGIFTASPAASAISVAEHFQGAEVPVTVRFSDGAPSPTVSDSDPAASPRGMAIRFLLPNGQSTDIVAISHNGFLVATGEEFLELVKAQAATDPSKPHPWPIEAFLGSHPAAMKFVKDPAPAPVSFATEAFFANNAFAFVDKSGAKQVGRYQILPVGGAQHLDDAAAKAKTQNFLIDELAPHLAKQPAKFRLVLQLAAPGDNTADSTVVWSDDHKKVVLGTITINSVDPDSPATEKKLAFDPTRLTDGIELSDDPLPRIRSRVYALSVAHRYSK